MRLGTTVIDGSSFLEGQPSSVQPSE